MTSFRLQRLDVRHLAFTAFFAVFARAWCGEARLVSDGDTVRLENDFFRLTIRPQKGGTSLDFFYKPTGKALVPKNEALPLFADNATGIGWRGTCVTQPYEREVIKDGPDQVAIHLVYISPWFHNGLAVVGEPMQYITPVPSGLARLGHREPEQEPGVQGYNPALVSDDWQERNRSRNIDDELQAP